MGIDRRAFLSACVAAALVRPATAREGAPALMLASTYRRGMPLSDYWVSEKYDGIRGYWDGRQLWTRGGERVVAPAWFTAALPAIAMDGELWAGHGRFEHALSTVRSQTPNEAAWREMRYMVFDLPAEPGDFTARLSALGKQLPIASAPWIVTVAQQHATNHIALQTQLDKTVREGGEGLVLHRGASRYRGERNADLVKFKPYDDAEARVIGQLPGRGKHEGRMGALLVETPEGRRFKLGGGFSDADRNAPPAVGSTVTYRYNGTNASGLPRFARFMRAQPASVA